MNEERAAFLRYAATEGLDVSIDAATLLYANDATGWAWAAWQARSKVFVPDPASAVSDKVMGVFQRFEQRVADVVTEDEKTLALVTRLFMREDFQTGVLSVLAYMPDDVATDLGILLARLQARSEG